MHSYHYGTVTGFTHYPFQYLRNYKLLINNIVITILYGYNNDNTPKSLLLLLPS